MDLQAVIPLFPPDHPFNTANIEVIKTFLNSVVPDNANFCTMDIRDFYLGTDRPAKDEEYMWIDSSHLTDQFIADYHLHEFTVPYGKSYRILMKICKTIYVYLGINWATNYQRTLCLPPRNK